MSSCSASRLAGVAEQRSPREPMREAGLLQALAFVTIAGRSPPIVLKNLNFSVDHNSDGRRRA